MHLSLFSRWLEERVLYAEVGPPYYTVTLFRVREPVAQVEEPSLELAMEAILREADLVQRQRGERWALRPNQPPITFRQLDEYLSDKQWSLNVRSERPGAYVSFVETWTGKIYGFVEGTTFAHVVSPWLTAPPVQEAEMSVEFPEQPEMDVVSQSRSLSEAARRLGVPRETLRERLRKAAHQTLEVSEAGASEPRVVTDADVFQLVGTVGLEEAASQLRLPRLEVRRRARQHVSRKRPETRQELEQLIQQHGSKLAAARALGVPRSTLRSWLERAKR